MNEQWQIRASERADQPIKTCCMIEMTVTEDNSFDIFGREIKSLHIFDHAVWSCSGIEKDMMFTAVLRERNQCREPMLCEHSLEGVPLFHEWSWNTWSGCAKLWPLCRPLIGKQCIEQIICENRNLYCIYSLKMNRLHASDLYF